MSKGKSIALWVVQGILAIQFLVPGVLKLMGNPGWIVRFRAWGYPEKFYLLVGLVETVGAVVFLVPRLSAYGAAALAIVMAGAFVTHILHSEIARAFVTVTLGILVAFAGYSRSRAWRQQKIAREG